MLCPQADAQARSATPDGVARDLSSLARLEFASPLRDGNHLAHRGLAEGCADCGREVSMRILGIDPGSAATGFGIVDSEGGRLIHVAHGTLRPSPRSSMAERLHYLHRAVTKLVLDHAPDAAVIEQVFVSASARSALVLGQARGVALAAVGAGGSAVVEYSASRIKLAVTGNGRAGKAQVQDMVRRLLDLDRPPARDAADALAAAICHANAGRIGALSRGARGPAKRAALQVRRAP